MRAEVVSERVESKHEHSRVYSAGAFFPRNRALHRIKLYSEIYRNHSDQTILQIVQGTINVHYHYKMKCCRMTVVAPSLRVPFPKFRAQSNPGSKKHDSSTWATTSNSPTFAHVVHSHKQSLAKSLFTHHGAQRQSGPGCFHREHSLWYATSFTAPGALLIYLPRRHRRTHR